MCMIAEARGVSVYMIAKGRGRERFEDAER